MLALPISLAIQPLLAVLALVLERSVRLAVLPLALVASWVVEPQMALVLALVLVRGTLGKLGTVGKLELVPALGMRYTWLGKQVQGKVRVPGKVQAQGKPVLGKVVVVAAAADKV